MDDIIHKAMSLCLGASGVELYKGDWLTPCENCIGEAKLLLFNNQCIT